MLENPVMLGQSWPTSGLAENSLISTYLDLKKTYPKATYLIFSLFPTKVPWCNTVMVKTQRQSETQCLSSDC